VKNLGAFTKETPPYAQNDNNQSFDSSLVLGRTGWKVWATQSIAQTSCLEKRRSKPAATFVILLVSTQPYGVPAFVPIVTPVVPVGI